MTFLTLKTRVTAMLRTVGANRTASDGTTLNAAVNEALQAFSVQTYCFFAPGESLTLASGQWQAALSKSAGAVFYPVFVGLSTGEWLLNHSGIVGPCKVAEILRSRPELDDAGTPARWAWQAPGSIFFDKKASSELTLKVAGYRRHGNLASDGDAVDLADEWQDALAGYIAAQIASSDGLGVTLDKVAAINEKAAQDLQTLVKWSIKQSGLPLEGMV